MSGRRLWTPDAPRSTMAEIAKALGEIQGVAVPVNRVAKQRRDYTARELRAMADDAKNGIPPASSPAAAEIRRSQTEGDFERANALIREVKEKAPALDRMARAAEKAERRAKRGQHIHICMDYPNPCNPANGGMGPCRCKCGAKALLSDADPVRVVWRRPDGTDDPFPDPREAEHSQVRRLKRFRET